MCSKNKFQKFLFLYIDSVPADLFNFHNVYGKDHAFKTNLQHFGITDSGPAFSGFVTAKLANKYEGSITKIDNLFKQFSQAGYEVEAYGYDYPI